MKRLLSVLALAAASTLAVPALAQPNDPTWRALASGPAENPPNGSPGTAVVTLETGGSSLLVDMPFRDLVGTTAAAHIHCCTAEAFTGAAPVALPFAGFPTGVHGGDYGAAIALGDAASWDPAFLSAHGGTAQGASSALLDAIAANEAYVNIHTSAYADGEIRGFLVAAPVPEPSGWAMLGAGMAGLLWLGRRRPQAWAARPV